MMPISSLFTHVPPTKKEQKTEPTKLTVFFEEWLVKLGFVDLYRWCFFLGGGIEQFGAPGKSPKSPNHSRVAILTPLAPPLTPVAVAIPMVPLAWVHLPPWSFRYPSFNHAQNPVNHGGQRNIPIVNRKYTLQIGPFSIATLVYQSLLLKGATTRITFTLLPYISSKNMPFFRCFFWGTIGESKASAKYVLGSWELGFEGSSASHPTSYK